MFTHYSLLPPSSFRAISSINCLLIDWFFCSSLAMPHRSGSGGFSLVWSNTIPHHQHPELPPTTPPEPSSWESGGLAHPSLPLLVLSCLCCYGFISARGQLKLQAWNTLFNKTFSIFRFLWQQIFCNPVLSFKGVDRFRVSMKWVYLAVQS